jgi:glycosyltransferase involved in cell wall biosynthesis
VLDHTAAPGGAEIALSRLLSAIDQQRYAPSVLLFADGPLRDQLQDSGIAVDVLPASASLADRGRHALVTGPVNAAQTAVRALRFTERLRGALLGSGAELIVANSLKSAVLGSLAARRARRPWVWHLHDRLSSDYLPAPAALALRILARHAPRHVVVNSKETGSHLQLGSEKLTVAYPGLPMDAFQPRRSAPGRPLIGILGRISETKGQREFLQAAAAVAASRPEVRFRVIGTALFNDHVYADQIREMPRHLGIADRVEFAGWADDPIAELEALTGVVHASPVPEPFGQVIVEAMARGVPVIATRGGGVTEVLDPAGQATSPMPRDAVRTALGQLVNPGDVDGLATAMSWLLDQPRAAEKLADQAYHSAQERFSISATAARVMNAWDRGLGTVATELIRQQ